ncbi:2-amino-4-hydroxy-6-hydroxymethyldihydropteridine diphosphokinase, partial [Campylobacter jejuni]|nr:2-amino-4-hydroxy-6-hydroxymethyldihydropteridine diphosphokinase [Campylobacter jejuni]
MLKIQGVKHFEKSRFFPFFIQNIRYFKYLALIGLGSKIEPEKKIFNMLFRVMMDDKIFMVFRVIL